MDELILYKSEDGAIKIDVLFEGETVWLTQSQMAELFGKGRTTITEHIKNIFEEGELNQEVVCRDFRHTTQHGAMEGKTQTSTTKYYNLDVTISVGYRVKSQRGTQFRIWATRRLHDYIIKGFALNDERFKSGSSMNYFRELLDRIREIRISERVFYQQIKDIYTTSIDYDPNNDMTLTFFKEVQNKLLWAVSGKTAAELVYYRANATLPQMGLTSTSKPNKVLKIDITTGKNYLTEEEITSLKYIVDQYLTFAEAQAYAHRPMYMRDWIEKLSVILTMNDKTILTHSGRVKHEIAMKKADEEYVKYKEQQRQVKKIESIKELSQDIEHIKTISKRAKK